MITKHALMALAVALPLTLGAAAAPALADDYGSSGRYDDGDRGDRGDYDRNDRGRDYDRGRGDYRDGDRRHGERRDVLSPRDIRHRLEARGYSRVRDIDFSRRSGRYTAYARDTLGSTFRLVVSARSGRVVDRTYIDGPKYRTYDRNYYDRYY